MDYTIMFALTAITFIPLLFAAKKKNSGKTAKTAVAINIVLFFAVIISTMVIAPLGSAASELSEASTAVADSGSGFAAGMAYIAAALCTGFSCIGAGIAVASAASSAIGATSENPQSFGKSLIFVALAEGVAIYGLLISLQIINSL